MPTHLPERPNLEQLRKQARERQRDDGSTLAAAQRVLANDYGFSSWPKLKHAVEAIVAAQREPDLVSATGDPVLDFLRLACLTYGEGDSPKRWAEARGIVTASPQLVDASLPVASAVGDGAAVRRHLAAGADPNDDGGPFAWPAILYLTYSRVVLGSAAETLRLLLAAGADPNAGYLWHGFPSPFTALTGVFGHGEQGPTNQKAHPEYPVLAEQLLAAGADPNDGQVLYNRQFGHDDEHLRLLFGRGLGQGGGGPWHQRLGAAIETPQEMVRGQLYWAVLHGLGDRVALLADHGVDLTSPFTDSADLNDARTPIELAAVNGRSTVVAELIRRGVAAPALSPADAVVAAILAGDRATVESAPPGTLESVRADRQSVIVWAAANGNTAAVALMLDLGFDVNAKGRGDGPSEEPWQTALHEAAKNGDEDMARLLLAAGADPNVRDARFDAPPAGWAHHNEQATLVELLDPLTTWE